MTTADIDRDNFRVCIDLDGVIFDFVGSVLSHYSREFSFTPIPRNEMTWNFPVEKLHFESYDEFWDWLPESVWEEAPLIAGAEAGIDELCTRGYYLVMGTQRGARSGAAWTHHWFQNHDRWGDHIELVTHLDDKTKLDCDVYIDDRPKTLLIVDRETQSLPLCFRQPWNDSVDKWVNDSGGYEPAAPSARVRVTDNWTDVVRIVDEAFRESLVPA